MKGFNFSKYTKRDDGKSDFEKLLDIFMQLLDYTNGDAEEALRWMTELDKEYKFSTPQYGIGDFIEDLKQKGYIDDQNEKGEIIDPINPDTGESWGWTDTADLNYDNMNMRKDMISDLKYWINEANIDGFRMDVAHKVPVDFFETVTTELNKIKPVFMLAEAEQPNLMKKAFDMHYAWEFHHLLNDLSKGHKNLTDLDAYLSKMDTVLAADDINMNFITNHDENSWNGTMKSRLGSAEETMTALSYLTPGMPLVYSGDEYGLDKSLKFSKKIPLQK